MRCVFSQLLIRAVVLTPLAFSYAEAQDEAGQRRLSVVSVTFNADSTMLAISGNDVRVYNALTGMPIRRIELPSMTRAIRFSPTEPKHFVTAGDDSVVRVWSLDEDMPVSALKVLTGMGWRLAYSPDGRLLCGLSRESLGTKSKVNECVIWDVKSGNVVFELSPVDHPGPVEFSPDGKQLAVVVIEDEVPVLHIYETESWERRTTLPIADGSVTSLAFMPQSDKLVLTGHGSNDEGSRIWLVDLRSDNTVTSWTLAQHGHLRSVAASGNDVFVIGGTMTTPFELRPGRFVQARVSRIEARSTKNASVLWQTDGPPGSVYLALSRDSATLAVVSKREVRMLNPKTGHEELSFALE